MMSNADRLASCIEQKNWDELLQILKPKFFPKDDQGKLVSPQIMAIIAQALTNDRRDVPVKIKIIILKCLMNSCVDGYLHKEYNTEEVDSSLKCNNVLYSEISNVLSSSNRDTNRKTSYPFFTHFPYTGVATWAVDYITSYTTDHENSSEDLEIIRLCIQFLCNLSTFACKSKIYPEYENIPKSMEEDAFKNTIMNLTQHEHMPIVKAACAYIQNTLTHSSGNYYTDSVKKQLILLLLRPVRLGCKAAADVLIHLMKEPKRLHLAYEDMQIEDKLCLLELLYSELRNSVYRENREDDLNDLPVDAIEFLSKKFRRKSDLILKTVDTYLDGIEPTEVTILLDILGALTSISSSGHCILQNDKSLLINCIFLLKSLQMLGKELNNYFTPVQKLSELAPSTQGIKDTNTSEESISSQDKDVQAHPAFGFKAGLVRVIGNMIHKHKENQDL
ncbi:uncharacterized protein LOC107264957 isoform X2 [Cephus cinctus]|nr:uncharacterized protein LOC107264957 isoform X2 [Cephus cinctus]